MESSDSGLQIPVGEIAMFWKRKPELDPNLLAEDIVRIVSGGKFVAGELLKRIKTGQSKDVDSVKMIETQLVASGSWAVAQLAGLSSGFAHSLTVAVLTKSLESCMGPLSAKNEIAMVSSIQTMIKWCASKGFRDTQGASICIIEYIMYSNGAKKPYDPDLLMGSAVMIMGGLSEARDFVIRMKPHWRM